jgi:hypothetical protein
MRFNDRPRKKLKHLYKVICPPGALDSPLRQAGCAEVPPGLAGPRPPGPSTRMGDGSAALPWSVWRSTSRAGGVEPRCRPGRVTTCWSGLRASLLQFGNALEVWVSPRPRGSGPSALGSCPWRSERWSAETAAIIAARRPSSTTFLPAEKKGCARGFWRLALGGVDRAAVPARPPGARAARRPPRQEVPLVARGLGAEFCLGASRCLPQSHAVENPAYSLPLCPDCSSLIGQLPRLVPFFCVR